MRYLQGNKRKLKKILASVLIVLTFNLYLFMMAFAEEERYFGKVTKHPPEILATPEEDIPKEKITKTSGWTWVILLVLAAGVAAAAAGGGGGNSSVIL